MSRLFSSAPGTGVTNDINHDLLMALINNMSEGVLAIDEQAKVVLSNSVALSILDTNILSGKFLKDAFRLINKKG